ncbi:MAG: aminotransferase class IV [Pseudomonadota bacterium]
MAPVLPTAYLNDAFVPIDEARVPALDRGFLFGDGVYEVVPYFDGQSLLLDEHVARLERSLDATGIANPRKRDQWRTLLDELVTRNGGGNQAVYVQVTRGADSGRDHAFPHGVAPTVFAMSSPLEIDTEGLARDGIAAVTATDFRWHRCDIKSTSLQANCMLREKAVQAGAVETIVIRDGVALEAAASSLFVVAGNTVTTTPNSTAILPGTTRDYVLELAQTLGLGTRIDTIPEAALRSADEIWLTAATRTVAPVTRLDGEPVGGGKPGPVWKRLIDAFGA